MVSVQLLLSLERLDRASCRKCSLALACHHDHAVLLSSDHVEVLLDALRAHRTRVDPWHADKLDEIREVIAALSTATGRRRACKTVAANTTEDIDAPDLADAAE